MVLTRVLITLLAIVLAGIIGLAIGRFAVVPFLLGS